MNKVADIIDENAEFLAMVESMDNGKPIRETLNIDVPLSSAHFRYFASCIYADEGTATMHIGSECGNSHQPHRQEVS